MLVCKKIFDMFLMNRISFRMNCHYVLWQNCCKEIVYRTKNFFYGTSFSNYLGNWWPLVQPIQHSHQRHVSYSMVTMERLACLFLALLITLLNFRKLYLFLVFKVHSCKSKTLSVDSPTYDILELHSALVRFYHNVHYKQRRIRSYGKVE